MLEKEEIKIVHKAYNDLAKKRQNWPNKYDINLHISKMLCDYTLLSKINLLNKKVLNIGCSEPVDEVFYVNLVKEWHALDINESAIKVAKKMALETLSQKLYSRLKFIVGDVTHLELEDEYYDVVTSFSTIDHIPGKGNRMNAIKEMYRVLKLGGYLVITVPNKWDIRYSYVSNKLQREGKAIFGYEYQFSPIELKKMLKSCGLEVIYCSSRNFNPYSYFDRFFKKLKLQNIIIYFGARFGYLCKKF